MTCYALTHEISGRRRINLPVCRMKNLQYWSHISATTTDGNYIKKLPVRPETRARRKRRRKKNYNGNYKAFCVTLKSKKE